MDKLHIGLIILAVAILGYIAYVYMNKKEAEVETGSAKKTGKAPELNYMFTPPMSEEEEVVQIYADTTEDFSTYYTNPEIEFGISSEEFERLVQKEVEKREYKIKKLERSKYINDEKLQKLNDITRNQMETISSKVMKKKSSATETIYEGNDYLGYRDTMNSERGGGISTKLKMSSLEKDPLSRSDANSYEY